MADAVDEKGIFYRGIEWLSERSDMSIRTVQRKITHLIDKGYLDQTEKTSRGRRATFKLTGKVPDPIYEPDTADDDFIRFDPVEPDGQPLRAPDVPNVKPQQEKGPLPLLQVYKNRDVTPANMADVNQSPTPDNLADVTPDNLTPTPDNLAGVHNIGINQIKPYRNPTEEIPPPPPPPNGRENLPKNTAVDSADDDDENINNVIDWINKTYPDLMHIWERDFKAPPSADCLSAIYKHRGNIGDGFPAAHIGFMKSQNVSTPDIYLVKRISGRVPLIIRDIAAAPKKKHDTSRTLGDFLEGRDLL